MIAWIFSISYSKVYLIDFIVDGERTGSQSDWQDGASGAVDDDMPIERKSAIHLESEPLLLINDRCILNVGLMNIVNMKQSIQLVAIAWVGGKRNRGQFLVDVV